MGLGAMKLGVTKSRGEAKSRLEASVTTHKISRYDALDVFDNDEFFRRFEFPPE